MTTTGTLTPEHPKQTPRYSATFTPGLQFETAAEALIAFSQLISEHYKENPINDVLYHYAASLQSGERIIMSTAITRYEGIK